VSPGRDAEVHRVGSDARDSDHQRLAEVARQFELGTVTAAQEVAAGLLNRSWSVVLSGDRRVFIKQVAGGDRAQAIRQHTATRALAARGLPVAAPLAMPDGGTLAEAAGDLHAAYPWIDGTHVAGTMMTIAQAAELGSALARIQQSLARVMEPAPAAMRMPVADPAVAMAAIDKYADIIASKANSDEFDGYVARQLRERRRLLETVQCQMPDPGDWWQASGWTHGDFHDLNVLWRGETITAVVDFDRLAPKPYAFELVRSATLTFSYGDERGLASDLCAAFAAGYLAVMPLADELIEFAADRLWWERVCDFWQLDHHYVIGSGSCDRLFTSANEMLLWWTSHRHELIDALVP
jgi:Ser/Thr protein kinase RdoA (MazF antagonist)